jgi:hypothetical protein
MIPSKLIEAVVIFIFLAAAAGKLPTLIRSVQLAPIAKKFTIIKMGPSR